MTNENLPAIRGAGLPYETAVALRQKAYALSVPQVQSYRTSRRHRSFSSVTVSEQSQYVVQPDRRLRRHVAYVAVVAEVLCLGFAVCVVSSLYHALLLRETAPHLAAIEIYQLWCVLAGCSMAMAFGYASMLSVIAFLTFRSNQSPPPGIGVLWQTRLRLGGEARSWAIKELLVAGLIFLMGCGFAIDLVWSI